MLTPSERRICCSIGICLLIAVLSSVALLNFFIYISMPAKRTLEAEFYDVPVVCDTLKAELGKKMIDCDDWDTCGEWCLSGSSFCNHVMVRVRQKGSDLLARDCTARNSKKCYPTDHMEIKSLNCKEKECMKASMNGTFLCSNGVCREIGRKFSCTTDNYEEEIKNCNGLIMCQDLTGIYDCIKNQCRKLLVENLNRNLPDVPLQIEDCVPTCQDMDLGDKNLIVFNKFDVEMAACDDIVELNNETNGPIWTGSERHGMVSCSSFETYEQDGKTHFRMKDCYQGVIRTGLGSGPYTVNQLMELREDEDLPPMDETGRVAPKMEEIQIYNETRLQVNLEGCVNTLRDECRKIFDVVGLDGYDGRNPPATFPCHYSPKLSDVVILNYDKDETFIRGVLFTVIPGSLIVVSCTFLAMCSKFVHVEGERMHIKICNKGAAHPPPHGFRGRAGNGAPFPGPAIDTKTPL